MKDKNKLKLVDKFDLYSFGIYLYAEPLNYLFLFIAYKYFGISNFRDEFFSFLLYSIRIVVSILIAVFIVNILKKLKLKFLY